MPVPRTTINNRMRFYEFKINESQGGIFRRAQEVSQGAEVKFKNAAKDQEIQLVKADVLPSTGLYATEADIDKGLRDYLAAAGVDLSSVQFTGDQTKAKAALVSIWKDTTTNQLKAFIKLAGKKSDGAAPIKQTNVEFEKQFGYGAQGKTAQRATLKLKPKDILQADTYMSLNSITNSVKQTIAKRSDLNENFKTNIVTMLQNVVSGSTTPTPGMAEYQSSLEIDLGETAAPIALLTGNLVGGDYLAAEKGLLAPLGLSWKSLKEILYPAAGSELIYDSYIKLDANNNLKVSSKDKKGGAAASITGLVVNVEQFPEKYEDVFTNKKFQQVFDILKIISNPENRYWTRKNKGINGPLILGVDQFKFISDEEAKIIVSMISKGLNLLPDDAFKKKLITANLKSLIEIKGAKYQDPAYNLGYHLLAALAKKISNTVNKNPSTGDLFRALLERSNMVQVKTNVKTQGDGAAFANFQVIYPPIFDGTFEMVADNNYMATRAPIGPLSFAIK
jgi:hypothetical protein